MRTVYNLLLVVATITSIVGLIMLLMGKADTAIAFYMSAVLSLQWRAVE